MPLMPPEMIEGIVARAGGWPKLLADAGTYGMTITRVSIFDLIANPEPWPHLVHYRAGKVTYAAPDTFMWGDTPPGPSDCTWIVPGTGERR